MKAHLNYGKIRVKLEGFQEQEKYFVLKKRTSLALILQLESRLELKFYVLKNFACLNHFQSSQAPQHSA